jgi:glycosyltransferase involved in cell wall biosynthesis
MNSDRSKNTIWHVGGEDVRFRIPLLLALRERGFDVGAVGSETGTAFADAQIPYYRYTLARGIDPLADLRTRREFSQLCQQYQPDLIHGFDTKPAMFAPIVAQRAGIRGRVRTINGMGYVFSETSPLTLTLRPIYRSLQRKASAATGITIFQNSDDRDYFNQHQMVQADRSDLVLGSGIDFQNLLAKIPAAENLTQTRQELGLDGKLVVTMIARLVVTKGVLEFLQAARSVCQAMPDVVFLLIGPLASEGKQAISIEEINRYADCVKYLGARSDIPTLLNLTDVFVLPTYYREGVPRVLLEAGAMALPMVTTDMPGCRDVVRDDWNGYLVPPKDATSLATAILKLLQHPAQRIEMGARSKSHVVENFSLDRVADAYADIYHRVLAQARS